MRVSCALSLTTMKLHGCWLMALGALIAASISSRRTASSTGSSVYSRTDLRPSMASSNSMVDVPGSLHHAPNAGRGSRQTIPLLGGLVVEPDQNEKDRRLR